MNKDLLERYGGAVPRYTSYPTAPHFEAGVTPETYRRWLGQITGDDALSLYFHVPFCASMCWYCGCHTKVVKRYQPIGDYAELLRREVSLVAHEIKGTPSVINVHWGGGTPSMLSEKDFSELMDAIRKHFQFSDDAEVAVEIDPRTMTNNMAGAMAKAGVTRASLGVQDFNLHVQQAINRIQPFEVTENAVARLRRAGVSAINFDLMYGLPGQTVDDVIRTAELAALLSPDRLSVFGYAHVPWMKSHQKMIDEDQLPDGPERMAQAQAAATRLNELGFLSIGLDHFARPDDALVRALDGGRLNRNFQGYTTDQANVLLGFGASAIGSLGPGYVQNAAPMGDYSRAVVAGKLPIVRGIALTPDDKLRRAVIEQLMCGMSVDLDETAAHFGASEKFQSELNTLGLMAWDGLVEIKDRRIHITPEGRPWMRTIAAVFDRYLETGEARHSRAV
ncbi:MAG: oxygen-independent coproporphyrinogen III oxidase [Rhodospirillales bacterium]|nr:oxygen-independent coproporphyrinogen III oxidase [Rhodospirillales bacterium]